MCQLNFRSWSSRTTFSRPLVLMRRTNITIVVMIRLMMYNPSIRLRCRTTSARTITICGCGATKLPNTARAPSISSAFSVSPLIDRGENRTVNVHFDVPKEGKYWIVLGLCDPDTSNVKVSGKAVIMNPYGHIPARMYGIIPFTKWVLLIYTALFLAWIIRCCWYRKELMSVHVMITVVVGTFLFDTVIRLLMLSNFNHEGVYDRKITMFSLFITSATRTVARGLVTTGAVGLGVAEASLGNSMWKIVAMGVVYFFFSLWDSIVSTYSTDSKVNLYRIIPASLLDSFIYFWILQSLLDTIQELEDKKQTGKLDVFISLRNIIIVAVIVSTLYNVLFSYLIMFKKIDSLWKYQWFFNDGVWTSSYLLLVAVIMVSGSISIL